MNIGDLEKWVDYSTPINGIVNDGFNGLERWVDYSTPAIVFSESLIDLNINAIFFGFNF